MLPHLAAAQTAVETIVVMGVDFRQVDVSLPEAVPDVQQTAGGGVAGLVHDDAGLAGEDDDGFGVVGVGGAEAVGRGGAGVGDLLGVVRLQVVLAALLAETLLEFAFESTLLFARSQQLIQHAIIMRVKN